MVRIEDVRRAAMALPGAEERASYGGRPSWRTPARMFTWVRDDPEALVVWVGSVEEKEALIGSDPDTFFTTAHYDGEPIVLVRLEVVDADEAAELITGSWRLRAPARAVSAFDARG
ncbi:MmcQ/YjbR family DNA-binding protein [Dermatobacter hominis]|uniref:MmcQ/YjbR family DNA-binding protein n=1 Tax=Dermatobacter hominis TaxID=2884263 RepID=UPI001D10E95F|nr:MmcQ/YjbR family DNA-binding protein [Dermatobacter hominis]UDY35327.1 MmcQ/YjbR family DNA-binding protein [Dermatobacter hominis]